MSEYPNWFAAYADGFFERHLTHLAGKPDLKFLQIGAFTGDASVWLLDNVLTDPSSLLVDVDTWEGSAEPEHEPFDWADVELRYRAKVSPWMRKSEDDPIRGGSVTPVQAFSQVFFDVEGTRRFGKGNARRFDFIYIDGDHTAAGVLADAVRAFALLPLGGLLAFDDYQWKPYPDAPAHLAPAMAIDTFTACYQDRLDILEAGLQVWVRKTA